jgi:hypothetical protein
MHRKPRWGAESARRRATKPCDGIARFRGDRDTALIAAAQAAAMEPKPKPKPQTHVCKVGAREGGVAQVSTELERPTATSPVTLFSTPRYPRFWWASAHRRKEGRTHVQRRRAHPGA